VRRSDKKNDTKLLNYLFIITFVKKKIMYSKFELKIEKTFFEEPDFNNFLRDGKERYSSQKKSIRKVIDSFVLDNGNLDGTKMQNNWFPGVKADIFLSHSHQDEELAIALSECLYKEFGLNVFIDSCIWGYADDLLKSIDNKYCKNPNGETYDYKKRNYSTSHVHMMLSTALTMMIDSTEATMFLNTPNSVTVNDTINKTESPWIYSEITMTQLIRQKEIKEYRMHPITELYSEGGYLEKSFGVEYNLPTEHLTDISAEILDRWMRLWKYKGEKYSTDSKKHVLDVLYELIKGKGNGYFEK